MCIYIIHQITIKKVKVKYQESVCEISNLNLFGAIVNLVGLGSYGSQPQARKNILQKRTESTQMKT